MLSGLLLVSTSLSRADDDGGGIAAKGLIRECVHLNKGKFVHYSSSFLVNYCPEMSEREVVSTATNKLT